MTLGAQLVILTIRLMDCSDLEPRMSPSQKCSKVKDVRKLSGVNIFCFQQVFSLKGREGG